jgi:hypothetical protein
MSQNTGQVFVNLQGDTCERRKGKLAEQTIVRLRRVDAGQKLMTKSGKQVIW